MGSECSGNMNGNGTALNRNGNALNRNGTALNGKGFSVSSPLWALPGADMDRVGLGGWGGSTGR